MPENYAANCRGMHKLLQENVPNLKRVERNKLVEILEHLFHNLWDRALFKKLFKLVIDFQADKQTIDAVQLKICLEHMKTQLDSSSANEPFFVNLSNQHPNKVSQVLQTLKLRVHQSRFAEQKLVALFQYCSLMDYVAEFLLRDVFGPKMIKDKFENIKIFLFRDTTYFLCHILQPTPSGQMAADSKFVCATIEYMKSFMKRTLPKCALNFKSCFNFVVSTLVGQVVRSTASEKQDIAAVALKCLTYLVDEMSEHFREEIALLDTFPANDKFGKLHELHRRIKYESHALGLTEELDCFLRVDTRSTDGLAALREQVFFKRNILFFENINSI